MNFNVIIYIIYIPIIFFIMIKVGWLLFKNGEVFLCDIFQNDLEMTQNVNKLLLIGYYLINLGATTITITLWDNVESIHEMISTFSSILGKTILLLVIFHYNNIFWIKFLNRKKQTFN
ncbi:hypothetical protein [Kordia sp.]|uniref:hypothetical protein n=1 Tax=Kordia sp. TaxID=1965332 RepID=UPI0025C3BA67|nr:hypothetical protein [Kordia sp.]MCH2194075.1 hypothetical protein [Kordia sp.]